MLEVTGGERSWGLLLSPLLIEGWQVQVQLEPELALRPELMPELEEEAELWLAPKLQLSIIIGFEPLGQSVRLEHWVVAAQALLLVAVDAVDIELLMRGLGCEVVAAVWARAGVQKRTARATVRARYLIITGSPSGPRRLGGQAVAEPSGANCAVP